MNTPLDEIKSKINIVDFIGSYIPLKKAGRNFRANCPFHQEKSPSFVISPDRQIWHCFGQCHEGGDAISFLMKWERITFNEALKELAQRVGVKLDTTVFDDKNMQHKDRLYSINSLAAKYYHYVLMKTSTGEKALAYLHERGLNDKIIERFQIGYAPQSWDSLMQFAKKKNVSEKELDEVGLVVRSDRGSIYDRFRGRITFPIADARGNIVGFSGRILVDDPKAGGKYVNTPETSLYHKRESLYGIDLAKDAIRTTGAAIIVEGEFDMIAPYMHGIENVVAVKGSAITEDHVSILKRYCNRIVFALDADASGEQAMKKGVAEAEKQGMEVEVLTLLTGKDPDEAVRTDLAGFKKQLKHTLPIYDYLIDSLQKNHDLSNAFEKKRFVDALMPYVNTIQNPVVKSHYTKKISQLLSISEESVNEELTRFRKSQKRTYLAKVVQKISDADRYVTLQKYVLGLLTQGVDPEFVRVTFRTLELIDFTQPSYQSLFRLLKDYFMHGDEVRSYEIGAFTQLVPQELIPVFDELYLFATYEENVGLQNDVRIVYELRFLSLKYKMAQITKNSDSAKDLHLTVQELTKQLNEVEKHLVAG